MFSFFKTHKKIFFAFLILVFVFYGNTLKNKYSLDDEYITVTNFPIQGQTYKPNNNLVKDGFASIPKIWTSRYAHDSENSFDYRPVVTTTFAIEYELFGQNPFISHLINIILYFILICLIYDVLFVIFKGEKNHQLIAFLSSIIFLIHPLHTEVVASLKCRDEILAFIFSISALKYTLSFIEKPSIKVICFIILFLFLGFLSKLSSVLIMVAIPFILLFYKKISYKKIVLVFIGVFILFGMFQSFANFMPDEKHIRIFYHFENPLYVENFTFFKKIIIGIKTFGFYIQMLFFPYPLRFYYGSNMLDFLNNFDGYSIITIAFIICSIIYYWKKREKIFLFGFLLFGLLSFPFLNILTPVAGIVGERLMFIPSLGFCILIASLISPIFLGIKLDALHKNLFSKPLIYLTSLVVICMIYSINRNSKWYDKLTLFEHDIKYLAKSAKANSLLGNEYFEMLRMSNKKYQPQILIQKCIKHYSQAVTNDSSFFSAYNNAGVVYYSYLKDYKSAKKLFSLAIRHKPLHSQAYENLGNCYKQENNVSMAFNCYKKSILIKPKEISSYLSCVNLFFDAKEFDKCLKCIKIAQSIFPNNYELIVQEANCYLMQENIPKAIISFELAYKIFPNKNLARYISTQALKVGNKELSEKYNNL